MNQSQTENSTSLKEKCELLSKEIETIKQEKELLKKHYEERIQHFKNEIVKEKNRAELKEIEFDEKFQVYQASTALQCDELESTWQARLNIVNQQLKDSNTACHLLRNQIADLKNRFSYSSIESEKRILELEQSVTTTEEKLRRTEEKLIANRQSKIQTYRTGIKLNFHSANNNNNPAKSTIVKDLGVFNNKSPHATPSSSTCLAREYEPLQVKISKELSKHNILTETRTSPNRPKKRKLYNVDEYVN